MEKVGYDADPDSPHFDDATRIVEEKGTRIGEAADMYGDLETAEDFGYVTRGYVEEWPQSNQKKQFLMVLQLEISSHPVHRTWWYHWDWSLFGHRESLYSSWPSQSSPWIYLHWNRHLCYDAVFG